MEILNENNKMALPFLLKITPIFILLLSFGHLQGQKDLQPVQDEAAAILAGLSGAANKIEKATLTKEDERSVTVSVRFIGFDDKTYRYKASILNRQKKPLEEINPLEGDVPKSRQIDITFLLSEGGKTIASQNIESNYLQIRVASKENAVAGLLEDAMGDINLGSSDFIFELNKKWMLMGANVKVNVTLSPYKSAGAISPN